MQEGPGPRARAADPSTATQELERVDGEDQARVLLEARDELVDLVVGRLSIEPALNREPEHRDRRRRAFGIDDAHLVTKLHRCGPRTLVRAGERSREVEGVDALVAAQLFVRREEVARSRLGRRRQPL